MSDNIPRRVRLDLYKPAETLIYNAIQEIERMGADKLLTDAVILLIKAKDLVADYIDRITLDELPKNLNEKELFFLTEKGKELCKLLTEIGLIKKN